MLGTNRLVGIVATTLFALLPSVTLAAFITIEPDNYATGADISHAISGVTLSTWSNVNGNGFFEFGSVGVTQDQDCIVEPFLCQAVTGSKYLEGPGFISERWGIGRVASCFANAEIRAGNAQCGSGLASTMQALIVQFDTPTDFFSISGTWHSDYVDAYAFDANFNLVGTKVNNLDYSECRYAVSEPLAAYCSNSVTQTTGTPQISYVLAGSWAGIAQLDTITFDDGRGQSVPEPGTLSLLGLGLAGLGFVRRRKLRVS